MPAGQCVLHRLGGSVAVLTWLVRSSVWRVVLHAVRRRHIPGLNELDELPCVRARVLLSGWLERAAAMRKGQALLCAIVHAALRS